MKLLIDTNVILDVLLKREPFYDEAAKVMKLAETGLVQNFISASAITDIYYIASRSIKDKDAVLGLLRCLLDVVDVAAVTEDEIKSAIELQWKDFEDSVQYAVALSGDMDGIVTRNKEDYKDSKLSVNTPSEIIAKMQ